MDRRKLLQTGQVSSSALQKMHEDISKSANLTGSGPINIARQGSGYHIKLDGYNPFFPAQLTSYDKPTQYYSWIEMTEENSGELIPLAGGRSGGFINGNWYAPAFEINNNIIQTFPENVWLRVATMNSPTVGLVYEFQAGTDCIEVVVPPICCDGNGNITYTTKYIAAPLSGKTCAASVASFPRCSDGSVPTCPNGGTPICTNGVVTCSNGGTPTCSDSSTPGCSACSGS